jgi:hypothetical protein
MIWRNGGCNCQLLTFKIAWLAQHHQGSASAQGDGDYFQTARGPVISVCDEVMVGFDRSRLEQMLNCLSNQTSV